MKRRPKRAAFPRTTGGAAAVVALLLAPRGQAWSQPEADAVQACVDAHESAQEHRMANDLLRSRGAAWLARLDGQEVEVNPGIHAFVFERTGLPPDSERKASTLRVCPREEGPAVP